MPRTNQEAVDEIREFTRFYVHDLRAATQLHSCLDQIQSLVDQANYFTQVNESSFKLIFKKKEKLHETRKHR